jgi:hypothetical protein
MSLSFEYWLITEHGGRYALAVPVANLIRLANSSESSEASVQ